jgi:DNA-binding transcriptional ArsR family regulator
MPISTAAGTEASPAALAAKLFRSLADPTRLSILLTLQTGERRVVDLVAELAAPRRTCPGIWPA